MRVGQLLTSVSRRRSGIFEFVCGLSREVERSGGESRVFGIRDPDTAADAHRWLPVRPQVARRLGPRKLGCAPGLLPILLREKLDLVHAHDLWTLQSVLTQSWAAVARRPYVVSIHGMLNPWALTRSRVKKRVAAGLYEGRRLRHAAVLHTVGEHETGFVREFGLSTPVAQIPYGMELPDLDLELPPPFWETGEGEPPHVLFYLGRFDPIKGLDNLVRAWARARREAPQASAPWRLVLAGWGEGDHESELRRLASSECPDGSVVFPGPLFGPEREAAYRGARACVLPSVSEGLPVSMLEAMARARPVLMTETCNLPVAFSSGAALKMGAGADGACAALLQLFALASSDLQSMGRCGRSLIEARFSWPVVGRQFLDVYRWASQGGAPPACVTGG